MNGNLNFFKMLALAACVFLAGYFLTKFIPEELEEYIEISFELFAVFVSFSIFAMTWHAYNKSKDNHALFLGATFLVIGILILMHTFSFPFMPDFITPNTSQKSAIFLVGSRFIFALLFLASAYVYKDTYHVLINKFVLLSFAVFLSFISSLTVLFYPDLLPSMYSDNSISSERILALSIFAAIILCGNYLYTRRLKKYGQNNLVYLIYGSVIMLFGDIVYFNFDLSAHLLIITGFYFMHLSLYKSSVELPYLKLADAEQKHVHVVEERYRNLFDNANDAIVTIDLAQRVTSWNKSAEKIFGWSAEEITGQKLFSLIFPQKFMQEKERIVLDTISSKVVSGIETTCLRKDGTEIDISLTTSPIRDENTNIIGMSGIIRDVTESKRAEEISLENVRLTLANRAKSGFLATMSHELRTPLNSILGFSDLLKQNNAGELNEKQEHYVDNVLASGRHLLDLINDILDLTKIEAGKMEILVEKISVPEAIGETLNLIKTSAEKQNILLKKEIDIEFIEADKRKFRQILFNLLSNAVKFSKPEGGVVTVKAKKANNFASFSVSDTGIGVKEEDMGKLFRVFQQLDSGIARKYGGTGLGLAITKQLVELHGGKIWFESKYGEGSTFTFALPLKEEN